MDKNDGLELYLALRGDEPTIGRDFIALSQRVFDLEAENARLRAELSEARCDLAREREAATADLRAKDEKSDRDADWPELFESLKPHLGELERVVAKRDS
jgi:hypothetical protein